MPLQRMLREVIRRRIERTADNPTQPDTARLNPAARWLTLLDAPFGMPAVKVLAFEFLGVALDAEDDHAPFAAAR